MSLLGIDVGTTGAKAVVFSEDGVVLGCAYTEYDISRPAAGHAELDAECIWPLIRETISRAVGTARQSSTVPDPVRAVAVDSMGENLVPVSSDRRILGPSIMNMDLRGEEFLSRLADAVNPEELYQITGNTLSNQFSIVKLVWMRAYQPRRSTISFPGTASSRSCSAEIRLPSTLWRIVRCCLTWTKSGGQTG